MKVQHSTMPRSEKCTDRNLASQWNSINWKVIKFRVNRLQTRIAKATHNENWNLVKRLTYLLTHSYSTKLLAVRIVTQNHVKEQLALTVNSGLPHLIRCSQHSVSLTNTTKHIHYDVSTSQNQANLPNVLSPSRL